LGVWIFTFSFATAIDCRVASYIVQLEHLQSFTNYNIISMTSTPSTKQLITMLGFTSKKDLHAYLESDAIFGSWTQFAAQKTALRSNFVHKHTAIAKATHALLTNNGRCQEPSRDQEIGRIDLYIAFITRVVEQCRQPDGIWEHTALTYGQLAELGYEILVHLVRVNADSLKDSTAIGRRYTQLERQRAEEQQMADFLDTMAGKYQEDVRAERSRSQSNENQSDMLVAEKACTRFLEEVSDEEYADRQD
jgi:hypothetical protein